MSTWRAGRLVLAIETSCDDTSVALLEDGTRLLAHGVASQDVHRLYGGVVPELASRAHLTQLPLAIRAAVKEAGVTLEAVTGIAVTHAPGLVGSLVIGVAYAKALAHALEVPVVGVNHIEAHLHSAALEHGDLAEPAVALIVSGGHTELVQVARFGEYRWLGATLDDAAGEAFDKTAKLLGLGFPGGPAVERAARGGNARRFRFPRPLIDAPGFNFSFSGLKTAVRRVCETEDLNERTVGDIAAGFQAAVVDVLTERTRQAMHAVRERDLNMRHLVVAGGVAANKALSDSLCAAANDEGFELVVPPPALCTDNGAMVAWAGIERLQLALIDDFAVAARARWPLDRRREAVRGAKA